MVPAFSVVLALVFFAPALASAQQPCTTDARRVVDELYRHMLERPADDTSQNYVNQLQSGTVSVKELVRSIATSPEHGERFWRTEPGEGTPYLRSVQRLYRHVLGRQPDEAGAQRWAQLAQQRGPEAVIDALLESPEYEERFGDWAAPGSGGITFCAPANATASLGSSRPVGTTGQGRTVVVSPTERWVDTGFDLRAGDIVEITAQGTIRLSENADDVATPSGSSSERRAANAPVPTAPAGGLLARIGNRDPIYIGSSRALRVPANGRLFLGVNDDFLGDNSGQYQVNVALRNR